MNRRIHDITPKRKEKITKFQTNIREIQTEVFRR